MFNIDCVFTCLLLLLYFFVRIRLLTVKYGEGKQMLLKWSLPTITDLLPLEYYWCDGLNSLLLIFEILLLFCSSSCWFFCCCWCVFFLLFFCFVCLFVFNWHVGAVNHDIYVCMHTQPHTHTRSCFIFPKICYISRCNNHVTRSQTVKHCHTALTTWTGSSWTEPTGPTFPRAPSTYVSMATGQALATGSWWVKPSLSTSGWTRPHMWTACPTVRRLDKAFNLVLDDSCFRITFTFSSAQLN